MFTKERILILIRAIDAFIWHQPITSEEKEECVRMLRILKKKYRELNEGEGDKIESLVKSVIVQSPME